jgi:hypothetical protein
VPISIEIDPFCHPLRDLFKYIEAIWKGVGAGPAYLPGSVYRYISTDSDRTGMDRRSISIEIDPCRLLRDLFQDI